MEIMVELNQEIVEKWCEENGFGLVKMYEDGDTRPLNKNQIKAEGVKGIIKRVGECVGIDPVDILKKSRRREIVEPRQVVHKIAHKHLNISLAKIGWMVGRKDHATVLNSSKKIDNLRETDKLFNEHYSEIIKLYSL